MIYQPPITVPSIGAEPYEPCPGLVVGLGASAGGLEPLRQFFAHVPAHCGISFIVAPNLDPRCAGLLFDLLSRCAARPVLEAADGMRPAADHVYIIGAGTLLTLEGGVFKTTPTPEPAVRLPIDTLFRSLAAQEGERAVGVVFSGVGPDGTVGLRAIKEGGGLALAQMLKETAGHEAMPLSSVETGLWDDGLTPEQIAAKEARCQLLETVINHVPAAVSLLSADDLSVQLFNPAYEAIASGEERMGQIPDELRPEAGSQFGELCRRVLSTGEPYFVDDELNMVRRPGGSLEPYFSWSLRRVRLPGQESFGLLNTFWETTARKRVEEGLRAEEALVESEAKRLALEAASMGLWDWRISRGELQWTERCKALFALPPDITMTYDLFLATLHPEDRERIDKAVRDALEQRAGYDVEMRVPWPDGSVHWIASVGRAYFDERGRPTRMIGVKRDITDRKLAEEALRTANAQLREADQRKDRFLAVLSHELRNPLAPIRNGLYILNRVAAGSEQARRVKAVIDRQVNQLAHLVDDLLDVTRITRDKIQLHRRRLDLNEVLCRSVEDHRALFDKAGAHLTLEPAPSPVFMSADENRMSQVVGNLLQNAVKFTPRGGTVTVTLSAELVSQTAAIIVRDTGTGMTQELVGCLFEPFVQADETLDRRKGGLGLGLALVKGLVELHGGEIKASSDGPGKGSEFVVRIPVETTGVAPAEQQPARSDTRRRRVLVIEDNVDAANSLSEALQLGGHEVAVAYNGAEGIAEARAFHPEVVICDIGLPGMDGYEVARTFRSDATISCAYLVALSGYALPEDVARARSACFDQHLAKPASIERINDLLNSVPSTSADLPS